MYFLGGDRGQFGEGFVGSLVVEPVGLVLGLELDVLDARDGPSGRMSSAL